MGGIDWSRKSLGFTSGIVLDRRLQSLQLLGWSVVYIWGKFYLFFSFLYGFKKKKDARIGIFCCKQIKRLNINLNR